MGYVLVYKLDRFSRNKYETAIHKKTLRDNGIKLLSACEAIPDAPEGIILESLLEGMAEYYSAELSQKVKRGMRELRAKGYYMGGTLLYGYKKDGKKVVINEDKASVVKYIYDEYLHGTYIKTIISTLASKGILHRGKPFAVSTIDHMLENMKYIGCFECNGEIIDNIFPQIIDPETFRLVQEKKSSNRYGKHKEGIVYLLKNKLYCGYCNKTMSAETGTARNGEVLRYYKCYGKKKTSKCKKGNVKREVIEKAVVDSIIEAFNKTDLNQIAENIMLFNKEKIKTNNRINLLTAEKIEIDKSISNLLAAVEKGLFSNATNLRLKQLEEQQAIINEQLILEKSKNKSALTKEDVLGYIRMALKKEAKKMINLLVDKVILYDKKIEIYYKYQKTKSPDNKLQ